MFWFWDARNKKHAGRARDFVFFSFESDWRKKRTCTIMGHGRNRSGQDVLVTVEIYTRALSATREAIVVT